jgi:hypothetical protein
VLHACRTISCALLGLYIFVSAFIYLSFVARFSSLTTNCPCASSFIALSALLVLLVGAFPFLSHTVLIQRNNALDLDGLHASHMKVRSFWVCHFVAGVLWCRIVSLCTPLLFFFALATIAWRYTAVRIFMIYLPLEQQQMYWEAKGTSFSFPSRLLSQCNLNYVGVFVCTRTPGSVCVCSSWQVWQQAKHTPRSGQDGEGTLISGL